MVTLLLINHSVKISEIASLPCYLKYPWFLSDVQSCFKDIFISHFPRYAMQEISINTSLGSLETSTALLAGISWREKNDA